MTNTMARIADTTDLPLFDDRYRKLTPPRDPEAAFAIIDDAAYETHRTISKTKLGCDISYRDAESGMITSAKLTVAYVPNGTLLPKGALVIALGYLREMESLTAQHVANSIFWMLREALSPDEISVTVKPSPLLGAQEEANVKWKRDIQRSGMFSFTEELLRVYLAIEVPRLLGAMEREPGAGAIDEAKDMARELIGDLTAGNLRISGAEGTDEQSMVLGQIARMVAVAAHDMGGVHFVGHHFEANPPQTLV